MIYRCGLDVTIVVWVVLILIVPVPVENDDFVVWNSFSLASCFGIEYDLLLSRRDMASERPKMPAEIG